MDERIPCKNPQCSHFILPATAARTEGYCMPCVQARYRQEQEEYIRKTEKRSTRSVALPTLLKCLNSFMNPGNTIR